MDDGGDGGFDLVVGDDRFDFDLREEIDRVFAAAVDFGVAFLSTVAFDLADGHAEDAEVMEGSFDVIELEGFDDGFDFFHGWEGLMG